MRSVFYFSRKERRAVCILAFLLLLGATLLCLYRPPHDREEASAGIPPGEEREINEFVNEIQGKREKPDRKRKTVFCPRPFDPNTCDSVLLLNMGLRKWQVRVFLRYREAGARFYSERDLRRVNAFSEEDVARLLPFARFPEDERDIARRRYAWEKRLRDSLYLVRKSAYPRKLGEGAVVSLNDADTTLLKKIPRIGSYYARKIVRYREELGGFARIDQLAELDSVLAPLGKWFYIEPAGIRKIRINTASFRTLCRHPYIRYEGARIIFQHREKYGNLTSLRQLSTEAYFEGRLEKLEPYVEF